MLTITFGSDTSYSNLQGSLHIFTYNYKFHAPASNNVFIMITFYNKQWEKMDFWNYMIYWVQYCHIHGRKTNKGEKFYTKENSWIQYMMCDHCGVKPFLCLIYLSIMNTKVGPKEVWLRQVSLYTEKVLNTFYIFLAVNIL